MLYYKLENFYQNHWNYINSWDWNQLSGKIVSNSSLSCSGALTNADLGVTHAIDGTLLNPYDPANPCGLQAKSFFNDTF